MFEASIEKCVLKTTSCDYADVFVKSGYCKVGARPASRMGFHANTLPGRDSHVIDTSGRFNSFCIGFTKASGGGSFGKG